MTSPDAAELRADVDLDFDTWIERLDVEVIQGEYGYEDGEFDVFPERWRPHFDEGLTPEQAFKRALDAHAEARREREAERAANWKRIQLADAALLSQQEPTHD
jgi:hypothetical protein